ncbi:MAG: hypothetical protein IJO70_12310 [Lachnospiraceae bacterium]|nr:hypothetical protein [Lachnospiraceae bacterium]
MEQGTLGELYLTRSVTKHIRKNNKAVMVGAGVGKDYSAIKASQDLMVISEGVAETPYIAWVKAINNFACSCGDVAGIRVSYMLPDIVEETMLKEYAGLFNALADAYGIQIMGGNTRVSSAYGRASFLVEVIGTVSSNDALTLKANPDYDIVMIGYTGVLGTSLIVDEKGDQLRERFASSYLEGCKFSKEDYLISPMVEEIKKCAKDSEVVYIHDVSYGGVYGALWQLGVALNLGVQVNHKAIPVKQETIELCNYFDINPYKLEGTGACLAVARDGKQLVASLKQSGAVAEVVGKLTQSKDRVVLVNEDEKRFLAPVKGDEIYKVILMY